MKNRIESILYWLPNKIFGPNEQNGEDRKIEDFMRHATALAVGLTMSFFLIFIIVTVISLFISNVSDSYSTLGTIGDYFGGMLNPSLAFLGFIVLLYTLRQNQKELNQATREMKNAADAAALQIKQDEVQHLLEIQSRNIDSILDTVFSAQRKHSSAIKDTPITDIIEDLLGNYSYATCTTTKKSHQHIISELVSSLIQLADITLNHQIRTTSDLTRKFYSKKYFYVINMLCRNEYLSSIKGANHISYEALILFAAESFDGPTTNIIYTEAEDILDRKNQTNSNIITEKQSY